MMKKPQVILIPTYFRNVSLWHFTAANDFPDYSPATKPEESPVEYNHQSNVGSPQKRQISSNE